MAALFDMERNFSFYTIPAAWVVCIVPHVIAAAMSGETFDNRSPRSIHENIKNDPKLDSHTKIKITRAEGAQMNGFENMGLFAAAVVAGNIAKLDNRTLNLLSGGYVVSRLVYNYIYLTNETEAKANARTGVFFIGIGCIFTLFIKSGNAIRLLS